MLIEEMENHIIYFVRVNDAAMVERKETIQVHTTFKSEKYGYLFSLPKEVKGVSSEKTWN